MKPADLHALFRRSVRELAYYLFVLRGCKQGRRLDDWIEAEKMLRHQTVRSLLLDI
jgi:hypothetical protein